MNPGGLLDAPSAERFGFAWLRAAVAPVSAYGARAFAHLHAYNPGEERAASERARAVEARARNMPAERVGATLSAIARLPDVASIVTRASIGEVLDDPDFYELLQFCACVEAFDGIPNEATRAVRSALLPGRIDAGAFYLADAFDDALHEDRNAMMEAQAEFEAVRGRERTAAARALNRDEINGDEFIVMRADLHAALPPGVRVVREAATYFSCALEYGAPALEALQKREKAVAAAADAEARARARLSSIVRENAGGLDAAANALAALDVMLAAVRYTQRHHCAAAQILERPMLAFEGGRFPPTAEHLESALRQFVPVDLALNGPAVITGPNMGGKTVAMQTCGFIALAAAFGLPVPARTARVALFDRIAWLGVGRDERFDGLLSSFAVEMVALKDVLDDGKHRLAVFIDEFARTTSPAEGAALTIALLERLREYEACGVAATHLPGIAKTAQVPHFAVRDYQIMKVEGEEEPSGDAIALAQSLGLDANFIASARRALKGSKWIP